MNPVNPVLDFVGKPITAGCEVAYPMRRGSGMWLTKMAVDGLRQDGETIVLLGTDKMGRRTHTRNIQNCVVVKERV